MNLLMNILGFLVFNVYNTLQQSSFNFNFPHIDHIQECEVDYYFIKGICVNLSQCIKAQNNLIKYGIRPTICSFNNHEPVVCCSKDKDVDVSTTTEIIETTTIKNKFINLRISERKCLEEYEPENAFFGAAAVGGEPAKPREFPYMAALGWSAFSTEVDFNCGGFLIAKAFVLTVAHCTSIGGAAPKFVRIGGDNLTLPMTNAPIERIWIHPNYNKNEIYNDIAIIKLSYDILEKPACLQQPKEIPFSVLTAIGYGHTQFAGRRSDQLIKVFLNIITNKDCEPYYQPAADFPNGIRNSQICAGDPNRKMDTCQGDSGGPLLYYNENKIPYVVGLTSFGQGCAGEAPSIYTRISFYLDWIESIVWPTN